MSYHPAFFNPDAYGVDLPCATVLIHGSVEADAEGIKQAAREFGLCENEPIISVRQVEFEGGRKPVHLLKSFQDGIPAKVVDAIRVCETAENFLASTDELDAAVAT
eukprot:3933246-Rhodomonas_salina.2